MPLSLFCGQRKEHLIVELTQVELTKKAKVQQRTNLVRTVIAIVTLEF